MEKERFIKITVEDNLLPEGSSADRIALRGVEAITAAYGEMPALRSVELLNPDTVKVVEAELNDKDLTIGMELSEEFAATMVGDLDFSTRAINSLRRIGIETLGQLCALTPRELTEILDLGKKTLDNIHDVLDANGLARVSKYPQNQAARYD